MRTVLALLVLAVLLVACERDDQDVVEVVMPDDVAATVDGREISAAAVDRRTESVLNRPGVEDPESERPEQAAHVLTQMILHEVVLHEAQAIGIRATDEDIEAVRVELAESVGGEAALGRHVRVTGVSAEQLAAELEVLATLHLVGRHLVGEDAADEIVQEAARSWVVEKRSEATVVINPRYGRWDSQQGLVVPHEVRASV